MTITATLYVRIDVEVVEALRALAERCGVSLAAAVEMALARQLGVASRWDRLSDAVRPESINDEGGRRPA